MKLILYWSIILVPFSLFTTDSSKRHWESKKFETEQNSGEKNTCTESCKIFFAQLPYSIERAVSCAYICSKGGTIHAYPPESDSPSFSNKAHLFFSVKPPKKDPQNEK